MSKVFYNIFIFLYGTGIRFYAFFDEKARLFIEGRTHIFSKLSDAFAENRLPVAWFHCASLGEFEQARPLIEMFKSQHPGYKILLTFFSPSGYEIRKNYPGADYIFYLPLDTRKNASRFLDIVKPQIVFFIKYEFWYHFTKQLKSRKIPILSAAAIFRDTQAFFKPYGHFQRKILRNFSHFFVQDEASFKLLHAINISNASIAGDTRFDRVISICANKKIIPAVEAFKENKKLMVVGSCWPEDFEVLTPFINDTAMKFIIAPHELDEGFMKKIENDLSKRVIRYSHTENRHDLSQFDVLLIDNIGMLSSLYAYGDYAYVGGAFGQGLHNILEPATFGVPVFFGNRNYTKFKEARDLINLGGAAAIGTYVELRDHFKVWTHEKSYAMACEINRNYVQENAGATKKIISYSNQLL